MVGRLGDVVGDVEQEDAEGEQHDDPDLDLLGRRAEEDGEEQDGRQDAGQDDVEGVVGVATLQVDAEGDVREALVRTALVEELVSLSTSKTRYSVLELSELGRRGENGITQTSKR